MGCRGGCCSSSCSPRPWSTASFRSCLVRSWSPRRQPHQQTPPSVGSGGRRRRGRLARRRVCGTRRRPAACGHPARRPPRSWPKSNTGSAGAGPMGRGRRRCGQVLARRAHYGRRLFRPATRAEQRIFRCGGGRLTDLGRIPRGGGQRRRCGALTALAESQGSSRDIPDMPRSSSVLPSSPSPTVLEKGRR